MDSNINLQQQQQLQQQQHAQIQQKLIQQQLQQQQQQQQQMQQPTNVQLIPNKSYNQLNTNLIQQYHNQSIQNIQNLSNTELFETLQQKQAKINADLQHLQNCIDLNINNLNSIQSLNQTHNAPQSLNTFVHNSFLNQSQPMTKQLVRNNTSDGIQHQLNQISYSNPNLSFNSQYNQFGAHQNAFIQSNNYQQTSDMDAAQHLIKQTQSATGTSLNYNPNQIQNQPINPTQSPNYYQNSLIFAKQPQIQPKQHHHHHQQQSIHASYLPSNLNFMTKVTPLGPISVQSNPPSAGIHSQPASAKITSPTRSITLNKQNEFFISSQLQPQMQQQQYQHINLNDPNLFNDPIALNSFYTQPASASTSSLIGLANNEINSKTTHQTIDSSLIEQSQSNVAPFLSLNNQPTHPTYASVVAINSNSANTQEQQQLAQNSLIQSRKQSMVVNEQIIANSSLASLNETAVIDPADLSLSNLDISKIDPTLQAALSQTLPNAGQILNSSLTSSSSANLKRDQEQQQTQLNNNKNHLKELHDILTKLLPTDKTVPNEAASNLVSQGVIDPSYAIQQVNQLNSAQKQQQQQQQQQQNSTQISNQQSEAPTPYQLSRRNSVDLKDRSAKPAQMGLEQTNQANKIQPAQVYSIVQQDQLDAASVKTGTVEQQQFSYLNATSTAQQIMNNPQLVSQNPSLYLNQQQQQINSMIENQLSLNQTSSINFPTNSSGFDELLLR